MASKPSSIKLTADLDELASLLAKRRGYKSRNAYIIGLLRYDAMVEKNEHKITLPISQMPLAEQDKVDQTLLKNVKSDKGERGQFLRRVVQAMVHTGDPGIKKMIREILSEEAPSE